jgi:zinc transporter ZupT
LATYITAAIAIHNIPEGLAISLVLIPRGASVRQAAAWSIFSSLPQPLMAVPAFLFVTVFAAALSVGLGFAAGAMIWMVFAELIPDANKDVEPRTAATATVLAFTGFIAFQNFVLAHYLAMRITHAAARIVGRRASRHTGMTSTASSV